MLRLCGEEKSGLVNFQALTQSDDIINSITKRFIKLDDVFIGRANY